MLPLNKLANITHRYVAERVGNLPVKMTAKEQEIYHYLQHDTHMNTIAKKAGYSNNKQEGFKKIKAGLYSKLIDSIIHISGGAEYQSAKSKILRECLSIEIMALYGFYDTSLSAGNRALKKALRYQMHQQVAQVARILFRHYTTYETDLRAGEKYFKLAEEHQELYSKELELDWQYANVRSKILKGNTPPMEEIKTFIKRAAPYTDKSIRLAAISYEMRFFEARYNEDEHCQIRICKAAMAYIEELPYNHDLARNIFRLYLLDTLISIGDLAKAELIVKQAVERKNQESPDNIYRLRELLFRVQLYRGKAQESKQGFLWMQKNVHKTGFPSYKERLMVYALYVAILNREDISMRKLHYNLNKSRKQPQIQIPFLIGKVIYYLQRSDHKWESEFAALQSYAKNIKGERHLEVKKLIQLIHNYTDIRYIRKVASEFGLARAGLVFLSAEVIHRSVCDKQMK